MERMSQYHILVEIDVEKQVLKANVELNYYHLQPDSEILRFYLHKNMKIESITSDQPLSFKVGTEASNWSPFIHEAKEIELKLEEPLKMGECLNLAFQYQGQIDKVHKEELNRISEDFIELGLYTPWFPLTEKLEHAIFNVKLKMDEDCIVVNARKENGFFIVDKKEPDYDYTIIASKNFKELKVVEDNINLSIFYISDKNQALAEFFCDQAKNLLKRFSKFGEVSSQDISIVLLPRKEGGGYCRKGLIVLTDDSEKDWTKEKSRYLRYIAHELSHLWWGKASTTSWEDWLNEAFAEYSSLLAFRDAYGENDFQEKIKIYQKHAENLPPIQGLDRSHEKAWHVLYLKGALTLYELEKMMGRDLFQTFLHEVYNNDVTHTEQLLNVLERLTNKEMKDNFYQLLTQ